MEKAFLTILRWLEVDDELEVMSSNLVRKILPKELFSVIVDRVNMNITLCNQITSCKENEVIIDRREFIDGFWGKCRLSIKRGEDLEITYKFLGYEAMVNGVIVLVDSIKSMMELGD